MKTKGRLLSILLAICMVLSFVPTVAFAEGPDGTEQTPPAACTVDESCTAQTHEADCPKYEAFSEDAPAAEEETAPADSEQTSEADEPVPEACKKNEGCTLTEGHEGECVTSQSAAMLAAPNATLAAEDNTFKDTNGIRYQITGASTVKVISDRDLNDPFLQPGEGIGKDEATYSGGITIPEQVTNSNATYSVTEIDYWAFKGTNITSITVPGSVKTLGSFSGCAQLTTVNLTEGLEEIGAQAFQGCSNLKQLTLPSTVNKLGYSVFGNAPLESVEIPAGVSDGLVKALVGNIPFPYLSGVRLASGSPYEIEGGVLYRGTVAQLYMGPNENVTLREGTTAIADDQFSVGTGIQGAFAQNYGLKSIILPDTIKTIPDSAFYQCVNLESVTLPKNLESIGDYAFYDTDVTNLDLPDSVVSIGDSAFQGCQELETIDLPTSLATLGASAFCDCVVLGSVDIPSGVTEIPEMAFAGCASLETITLPDGVTSIGNYAFDLTYEDENGDYVNPDPKLQSINIPSSVTSLGDNFLGGIKPAGGTTLVSAADPSIFTDSALVGVSGDGMNAPTLLVPDNLKDAYKYLNASFYPSGSEEGTPPASFELTIDETASVCPGKTVGIVVSSSKPEVAELTFTSIDDGVATVDENGIVTGVAAGEATITASITLNGITLTSKVCTVTVGHRYAEGWESNDVKHWHECACGARQDEAAHTYANGKCTVCGADDPNHHPGTTEPTDPSEPSEPTTPSKPDDTGKPGDSSKPGDTNKPDGTGKPDSDKGNPDTGVTNPQTGDNSNLALWFILLFAGLGGLTATTIVIRKRKSE